MRIILEMGIICQSYGQKNSPIKKDGSKSQLVSQTLYGAGSIITASKIYLK